MDPTMARTVVQSYQTPLPVVLPSGLNPTPWFLWQMAQRESAGGHQFIASAGASNGFPLFGGPNGWGLMQIEYQPNTASLWDWHSILWNWRTNIQASVDVLSGKLAGDANHPGAYDFWQRQVNEWHDRNRQFPNDHYDVAQPDSPGNCRFAMVDDAYGSPPAGSRIYADAIWIKMYNGAPTVSGDPYSGNYIAWQRPGWWWNYSDGTPQRLNYVAAVCAQTP